jgi:putative SbcD/Mre11-related phosphoesterase
MLELTEDINATEDGLGIYIPEIKILALADLHIGIELALFNEGTYLPINQFRIMQENVKKLIKKHKPELLIINGDVKHEFSRASPQEWFEFDDLLKLLNKYSISLEIVRGNHDNYLKTILSRYNLILREPYFELSRFLFMHGHMSLSEMFPGALPDVDWLILAHEHPAIVLYDDVKGKHKFRCYLLGRWQKYKVLVLPAYSPFTSGSVLNEISSSRILSPVLQEISVNEFTPIIIDKNEVLKFPKLKDMIKIDF